MTSTLLFHFLKKHLSYFSMSLFFFLYFPDYLWLIEENFPSTLWHIMFFNHSSTQCSKKQMAWPHNIIPMLNQNQPKFIQKLLRFAVFDLTSSLMVFIIHYIVWNWKNVFLLQFNNKWDPLISSLTSTTGEDPLINSFYNITRNQPANIPKSKVGTTQFHS